MVAYRLGLQQLNSRNFAESIAQFKLAQSLGKPTYDMLYNLGRAYRQYSQSFKGKDKPLFAEYMKLAAEQFEAASRLKSSAFDAFFQLGMCYREMALYSQATIAFKSAQQLLPRDPATYYQLGMLAMEQGYNREAEGYFLEGLKLNSDHALILVALGRLYGEMDQLKSAIDTLRQATQREPALPDGWYELGRIHMKTREWKLALSALEQARQLNSDASDIYSAMASCYQKMNKKTEARQMIRDALQLDSSNSEALRVQKQL